MRTAVGHRIVLLVALGVIAAASAPVGAQEHELTLLGGLRIGGEFEDANSGAPRPADESPSIGLVLGFALGDDRTLEIVWTHQQVGVPSADDGAQVDLRLDTVGVGGTYEWGGENLRPFVSATAGLAVLSPQAAGYDFELLFSATLGGGVKVPISARVGLRLEGRGVALLTTGSAAGLCGASGCVLAFSGTGMGQLELLAGLALSF